MTSPDEAIQLDGAAGWAVDLMETMGGPGAGLAIFVENLFPPIPSEVILPMAGFAARLGELSVLSAIVWTTAGSVLGAWMLYALGAWLGHDRIRRIVSRMPLMDGDDVDKTRAWFEKHGHKAVFFGRMLPLFRSFISIPAGVERMNFAMFTGLTTLGSAIWNSVFVLAGYLLGANWHRIDPYAAALQYVVLAAVVIGVGWFIRSRLKRRARSDRAGDFSPAK
ncbi:MAG: DedA family protein [Mycolicibacterium sp.]|nr:DedA family protein [Mycolicibacterium sp.]